MVAMFVGTVREGGREGDVDSSQMSLDILPEEGYSLQVPGPRPGLKVKSWGTATSEEEYPCTAKT
jgi:hypothetical protein